MSDKTRNWLDEFSDRISELCGVTITSEDIHHDNPGYYFYIQSLKRGYPFIGIHYRGQVFAVLPYDDFQSIEKGKISVDDYINQSHFSFGYYWGNGELISGAYWQPLEDGCGIHDTERISRYLCILRCRTFKYSSGYGPSEMQCNNCQIDCCSCPMSPINISGKWENEIPEPDGRVKLFEAIQERLEEEGLKMAYPMSHDSDPATIRLRKITKFNKVVVSVNMNLLNDLLYHPGERDWKEMAQSFKIIHIR